MVLNQAIGKKVESLILNRWVARLHGDRRPIFDFTISDRAEIHRREVELDVVVRRGKSRRRGS